MAPGTDVAPLVTRLALEHEQCKGSASSMEDEDHDTLENLSSNMSGKPPRNLSVIRQCNSSAWLSEMVSVAFHLHHHHHPTFSFAPFVN